MPDNRSVWTIQGSGNGCLDWSKYNRLKCVWVFGRKLDLSVELEPELIGGIRVVVGDEVLDTSVKARLEQMKVALTA